MLARQGTSGKTVNRMLQIDETSTDLLYKLEAIRLLCKHTGCAQRYLTHDAFNAIFQSTRRSDAAHGTDHHQRFLAYMHRIQDEDLTCGIAMTDAKGDRSKRPHEQVVPDVYVHIVERRAGGIVISGTKAIVTGAPYVHEFLVMPGPNMMREDADFAVCCAVPIDAPGITIVARPPGRPTRRKRGEILRPLRPVDRRGDLRQGIRAIGSRFPRRRVERSGVPDADLCDASPP